MHQISDGIGDVIGEEWFAVDLLRRLLRVQCQQRPFRMNDAVADLHFLVLVHERLAHIRVVAVLERGTANQRGPIRNGFLALRQRQIFSSRQHWRGGANRADWRHVNVLSGQRDECAC